MLDRILFSVICFLMVAGFIFTLMMIDALARQAPFWLVVALLATATLYIVFKLMHEDHE